MIATLLPAQSGTGTIKGRLVWGGASAPEPEKLKVEKDPQVVVVRTSEGRKVALPRGDIAEMRVVGTSLMPEGLLRDLTAQQAADLLEFLSTLKGG